MKIFKHEGHTAYEITKNIVIMKRNKSNRFRFYFPEAGLLKGLEGFKNVRFSIRPRKKWKYFHWLIRFPGFYWMKSNHSMEIGTNNLYLWIIK